MIRKKRASAGEEISEQERPSRSAKKRASTALQKLGEELTALSPAQRQELDLPRDLLDALAMHDSITDREGARRQRQYIGRLMRELDAEAIKIALDRWRYAHGAKRNAAANP